MRAYLVILFPLVALTFAACSLFGDENETNARVTEEGVDGIWFGDSIEEVQGKLGHPRSVGWVDGRWGSWYHFTYGTSGGDTLTIYFTIPSGGPDSLSVADVFVLRNSYSGRTADGIGIGSSLSEVYAAFGEPNHIRENAIMYYCMGHRYLEFYMAEDTLSLFALGFKAGRHPDFFIACG